MPGSPSANSTATPYSTIATPSLAIDSPSTIVNKSTGTCSRRKIAITATGSVADTIAPNTNAAASGSCPESAIPKPIVPATSTTPGSAKSAIRTAARRSAAGSIAQAASKISGGRKMNRSASPKWNGSAIGWTRRRAGSEGHQRDGARYPQALRREGNQHRDPEQPDEYGRRPSNTGHTNGFGRATFCPFSGKAPSGTSGPPVCLPGFRD